MPIAIRLWRSGNLLFVIPECSLICHPRERGSSGILTIHCHPEQRERSPRSLPEEIARLPGRPRLVSQNSQ